MKWIYFLGHIVMNRYGNEYETEKQSLCQAMES